MKKKKQAKPMRLDRLTKAQLLQLKRGQKKWEKLMAPRKEAIRRSTLITAADLAIIVRSAGLR